jgi:molybdopterin molybdotransferase|tara:strand:- start:1547 stop:2776 length:1230 start_codon:yes stop_codon:yes gene_type:complete
MKNYLEALTIIQNEISAIGTQQLDTKSVNGVIAEDIFSNNPVPSFSNSAMDGFCLQSELTQNATSDNPVELKINGTIFAGDEALTDAIGSGSYEIMTGSMMPDYMDSVLTVEKGEVIEKNGCKTLVLSEPVIKGANVRRSGEDYQKGELILSKGTLINDHHKIGLIMNNHRKVKVYKKPSIGILTTGSELDIDSPSSIPNSNGPFLESAVNTLGLQCIQNLHSGDELSVIKEKIQKLRDKNANLILTSGGVSAGKADFIPAALVEMGAEILFHKLWIRPGKPILMAKFPDGEIVFGLPGNPVSVAVGFRFLASQAARIMQGRQVEKPINSINITDYKKSKKFNLFAKAIAHVDTNGQIHTQVMSGQESFKVKPFRDANCWAMIPEGVETIQKGEQISIFPLSQDRNIDF